MSTNTNQADPAVAFAEVERNGRGRPAELLDQVAVVHLDALDRLQYLAFGYRQIERPAGVLIPLRWLPRLVGIGLLALLSAVLAPMLAGAPPLTHYPRPAQAVPHLGSFALHTGTLVDVGVFLVVLGFGLTIMSRASRHADAVDIEAEADTDTEADARLETRSRP